MNREPRKIHRVDTGPSVSGGHDRSHPSPPTYGIKESPQDSPGSGHPDHIAPAVDSTPSGPASGHGRAAPPPSSRTPEALATTLYEAISSGKKDATIPILCREHPDVVAAVATAFEAKYTTHLHKFIRERLGGADRHFVALLEALAAGPYEFGAMRLREALTGQKITHLTTILKSDITDILVGRPYEDIRGVRDAYRRLYRTELHFDISEKLSAGHYRELMIMIAKMQGVRRSPSLPPDPKADAETLYEAGEGVSGTRVVPFLHILADRSDDHLLKVFEEYHRAHGKSLEDAIKSENFDAQTRHALVLIIRSIINRTDAVVRLFNKALSVRSPGDLIDYWIANGSKADDGMLVRLIVEYRAPDIRGLIKEAYLKTYNKPMSQRMRELIRAGDYLDALVACLGEYTMLGA